MIKKILLFLYLCIQAIYSTAVNIPILTDSSQLSLLTNAPWQGEVYSVFGHTAVRIEDQSQNIDFVFNYGLFDFNSPNFILRFIKGQTDYMVGAIDTYAYLSEYESRGVNIYQQNLNLTLQEKQKIWEALYTNSLPQNREYRYNFLFDNCSTRPRDIIEKNLNGKIIYSPTSKNETFRDLIHECVQYKPWLKFGIDIIIGSGADKIATDKEKMFLPSYLMDAYTNATIIQSDNSRRKLVIDEKVITTNQVTDLKKPPYYPLYVSVIVLFAIVFISYFNLKLNIINLGRLLDFLFFTSFGLAGCIIAFLIFFSEHPCTSYNWNIVWLNPFQLGIALLFFGKRFIKTVYYYHFTNFAILTLFLAAWFFIPQHLEIAFIPLVLIIWVRSLVNILLYRRNQNRLDNKK